ncbi:MAG: dihydroorotase [Bacteroidia bacterium]|nr:dihydroorotase [Bacteroidia bacterium]MBP7260538.1 dihydroorotase [Bacteroidia bacterium]MBP9180820.1 dihydroorotase [Bacteroidia bacterium]MBP9725601.1 dihydroorotase [Bacteroidia bacterium]
MKSILIKNATLVNENQQYTSDVLIKNGRIERIARIIDTMADKEIDASGLYLIPGAIDDQVHFREPGLTHKGEIYTEAKAAVAGGVTSYMEMPNTVPGAVTIELLEEKYSRAAQCSLANYSFFMGTTNSNIDEVKKVNPLKICGVKIFMGSSTGDMLVDDPHELEAVFAECPTLIATHCEDDPMIKLNMANYKAQYGEDIPIKFHGLIRSEEACYKSSSYAVELAKKYNTRLHVLHISTAKELQLFRNDIPLKEKRITAEACIHHLWFSDADYDTKGTLIKWNPAVKTAADRDAIFKAVLDNRIDVIATDHAPHTLSEKANKYAQAPSGGPLVQHSILAMLDFHKQGKISLEKIVEKMSHAVADLFRINNRGYIREGYWADLVLVDLNSNTTVTNENILYKCGWSPFEGQTFPASIHSTFVNGHLAYHKGKLDESQLGHRMEFDPVH